MWRPKRRNIRQFIYTTQYIHLVITGHHIYTSPDFVKGPPEPSAPPSLELLAPEPSASPSLRSTSSPSPELFRNIEGESGGGSPGPSWIIFSIMSSSAWSLRSESSIISAKCEMHTILFQNA